MKTFYLTTPIYYANSLPHLGHLYTTTVADVLVRHKRQRGVETFFLTGTDEHGVNIQRAAEAAGRTPKEQVDHVVAEFKRMFGEFGLSSNDIFMRTTEPFHYEGVQHLWREIAKGKTPKGNENIYKGFYEGWFCPPCAAFKTEEEAKEVEGTDVPVCPDHERPLDRVSEESYFFRLSDYGDWILSEIEANPQRLRPEARRNEVVAFVKQGLQDLSISRERKSVAWGIPVPGDDNHVMYVWLDALSNYITALGYGNSVGKGFDEFWPVATHFVGKDILRFHTVYWWSFLKAAGLPLPQTVFAHGMWLDAQGRKMSKTLGNGIELPVLQKHFQIDAVRYFLLREMVFGQDGNFGYEGFIERCNADLANGLGNLAARTLSMIEKYRGGEVPVGKIGEAGYLAAKRAGIDTDEQDLANALGATRDEFVRRFDLFEFSQALENAWTIVRRIDTMISDSKPWELAKDEGSAEPLNAVLYRASEAVRWLCVLLSPVMPESTAKIWSQFGQVGDPSSLNPENLAYGDLIPGTKISPGEIVFPRIDKKTVMSEIENNKTDVPAATVVAEPAVPAEVDNFITIDDFLKVEMRVGEIKVAERIPNADKLLRFEIDLGEEKPRQILAGLAEYYEPEKLIGRRVVVVANLKPRKMRGLESQGMICAASLEGGDDKPAVATFLESVEIGARLK